MFGDGRIQGKNATHWQIGDGCEDKGAKDRWVLFSAAHEPKNGPCGEQYPKERLSYPSCRGVRACRVFFLTVRLYIALHAKVDRKENQPGVFGHGASGQDGLDKYG